MYEEEKTNIIFFIVTHVMFAVLYSLACNNPQHHIYSLILEGFGSQQKGGAGAGVDEVGFCGSACSILSRCPTFP